MAGIIEQLNINSSVWTQLVIFIITLIVFRFAFIGKLKEVAHLRADQIESQGANTDELTKRAQKILDTYQSDVTKAYASSQDELNKEKNKMIQKLEAAYRTKESSVNEVVEADKKKVREEFEQKKTVLMSQVGSLANDLINKIKH